MDKLEELAKSKNRFLNDWLKKVKDLQELSKKIIECKEVDNLEISLMQSDLKDIISFLETKKEKKWKSIKAN